MELVRDFPAPQLASVLDSWAWLDLDDREPVFATCFGDIVLRAGDGSHWFLDVIGGGLVGPWADRAELDAELATDEGRTRYLLGDLADAAEADGRTLGPNQVFDFLVPPVLGGAFEVGNLSPLDFVVAADLAGQIHGQVRGLPLGTIVSGRPLTTVRRPAPPDPDAVEEPTKRRFWKRR